MPRWQLTALSALRLSIGILKLYVNKYTYIDMGSLRVCIGFDLEFRIIPNLGQLSILNPVASNIIPRFDITWRLMTQITGIGCDSIISFMRICIPSALAL